MRLRPVRHVGEAARSSPFPPFTLYCKLQSAIKCLHHGAEANTCARPRRTYCMGPGRSDERETDPRAPPAMRGARTEKPNRGGTMARKPKMKKGKPPKKMAKGGTLQDGLVKPLEKSYGGAEKMIGDIRAAKNKMPKVIRDAFPNF